MVSKVGVIQGEERKDCIQRSLKLIEDEVKSKINRKRRVIIKPNLGFLQSPLACTSAEAVEAVLEFLRTFYTKKIIIAESTAVGDTKKAFAEFGYQDLVEKYDVELVDLNEDDFQDFKIYSGSLKRDLVIGLSKTMLKSDFIISICPVKTHDSVIVTLGIKNVVLGSIGKKKRSMIHQGPKAINLSIAEIAQKIHPSLTILDGFEAMEGEGPVRGDKVDLKIAVVGTDPVATDIIATILMGFNPEDIGYLQYCSQKKLGVADPLKIAVVGVENYRSLAVRFKPHHSYQQQLNWRI